MCEYALMQTVSVLPSLSFSARLLNIPSLPSLPSLPSPPPSQQLASKSLNLLSLPYFPWAKFNWSMYPLHAPSDLLAGLTVGIMLVPQGRRKKGGREGGQSWEAYVLPFDY